MGVSQRAGCKAAENDETDCETTGSCGSSTGQVSPVEEPTENSLGQQTLLSVQQLSVIVGVALLVGGMFTLMIWMEIAMEWLEEKCRKVLGRHKETQEVDPAALVVSFKRYK